MRALVHAVGTLLFRFVPVIACLLMATAASAKEQRLVFAGYEGLSTLTDFQALVKLTEGQYGFSYADFAAKDGSDLYFTDAAGNVLAHEIDRWDPSGPSFVWVRVPELKERDTAIVMHWGVPRTAEQTAATRRNVWKNNKDGRGGYVGVWHMGTAAQAEPEPDATGNGLDAEPYTETDSLSEMTVAGPGNAIYTGGIRVNAQNNGKLNALKVPDYSRILTTDGSFTLSGWFRASNPFNGDYKRFFASCGLDGANSNNGFEVRMNGDGQTGAANKHRTLAVTSYDGVTYVGAPQHVLGETYLYNTVHITVVFSGRVAMLYQNGVFYGASDICVAKTRQSYLTAEDLAKPENNFGFLIGHRMKSGNGWIGWYDEVRLYDGAKTSDRIRADYATMKSPQTFLVAQTAVESAAKSQRLVFDGYKDGVALKDFQALVKLNEGQYDFSYSHYPPKDGSDLYFTDVDGNVLPHEIDTWNPAGDSFVWVRVPEVSSPTSAIVMHWGAPRTPEQTAATRANVWKNNKDGRGGYVGVWHMGRAIGGEPEPDETGNGLDAVPLTGSGHLSAMLPSTVEGFPTKARQNGAANGQYNSLKVPDYSKTITDESRFTLSGWFRCTADNGNYKRFFSSSGLNGAGASNGWEVRQNGDGRTGAANIHSTLAVSTFDGTTAKQNDYSTHDLAQSYLNNAVYLTVVFDGSIASIYQNGQLQGAPDAVTACKARQSYLTAEQLADPINNFGFLIGNRLAGPGALVGSYDEVRLYDGVESAARIKANYEMMKAPTEFLIVDNAIETAQWTGAGNDGDILNSSNWTCKNLSGQTVAQALPTADTRVTLSGSALVIAYDEAKTLRVRELVIGGCVLAADTDLRGFRPIRETYESDRTVDLNGKKLTVSGLVSSTVGAIVNNAADTTAEVRIIVPDGVETVNDKILIAGNIRVVKDGPGTFTSACAQAYTAETEIVGGILQAPKSTAYEPYTPAFTVFGHGKLIVSEGGVYCAQSLKAYHNSVILNGGTIVGGVSHRSNNTAYFPTVMLEKVEKDSFIRNNAAALQIGTSGVKTDLNGHTVTVTIADEVYFRWFGSLEGVEGKIVANGVGGYLNDLFNVTNAASRIDLDVNSCLNTGYPIHLRDFRAANPNNAYASGAKSGVYVSGTYTPVGYFYYGCTLQNGATLNLSDRALPFSATSALNNNRFSESIARRTVLFDSGAVVKIRINPSVVATPVPADGLCLMTWGDASLPVGVRFVLDGALQKKYQLFAREDGVWLQKRHGLVFYVQ
jgi:hypothetical protein